VIVAAAAPARAIDAVSVRGDAPAIDLTAVLDHQRSDTDRNPGFHRTGTDGIVRRIEVRAVKAAITGWCSRSPTTR